MEINRELAAKVLSVVDAGLSNGLGKPTPGNMCVEAAVCYAMGLPHGDDPGCVSPALRQLKIRLNDNSWSSNEARARGLRRLAIAQLGSKDVLDEREFVRRVIDLAIRKYVPVALRAAASVQKDSNHKAAMLAAADRCEKEGTRGAALEAKKAAADADADAYAYAAANAAANANANANAYAAANAAANANANANAAAYAAAAAAAYAAAAAAAYAAADAYARLDKILSDFAEDVVQILIDMKAPGAEWLDLAPLPAAA